MMCALFTEQLPFENKSKQDCEVLLKDLTTDIDSKIRPSMAQFIRFEIKNVNILKKKLITKSQ